jgi:hypothetical protein
MEMLKMPNVIKIRDLAMEGKTKTDICKETGYDFKTVTKYLEKEDLSAVIPSVKHRGSKLDPYKDEMEYILYGNSKNAWHKQQLTATRLYSLILEKHPEFNASYSAVQRFVKRYKQNLQIETGKSFSRLIWHPGEAGARIRKKMNHLERRGLNCNKAAVAGARELACFAWGMMTGNIA